MAKRDLIHTNEGDFARQLLLFKEGIPQYAAVLGVTPAQMTAQAADADYYNYALACHYAHKQLAQGWRAQKKSLRRGKSGRDPLAELALTLPPAVAPVPAGLEARFRLLLRQAKASPNYNIAIGQELGIEAPTRTPPDPATFQPRLRLRISGSHVQVGWDWQGQRVFLDQCEIQVDRGDGCGFVTLIYAMVPGTTDPAPLPAEPARWIYRAIYRVRDARFGKWSDPASIIVCAE